ncbi:hypothetical protein COBT_002898 [Conglomerata obtusa]
MPINRSALTDKTNYPTMQKKINTCTDKSKVLDFLTDVSNSTKDYSLKYNLKKCIEIVEGKENVEVVELKDALEDVLVENEALNEERNSLIVENEFLRKKYEER